MNLLLKYIGVSFMGIVFAVRHIMTKNIITVKSNASVVEAASVMVENDIGSVVVTIDRNPAGIITEKDLSYFESVVSM